MNQNQGSSCALPDHEARKQQPPFYAELEGLKAEVFSKPTCPHCRNAIDLLKAQKVALNVVDVSDKPELRDKVSASVGHFPTVPMIFLAGQFVGGCDDLRNLLFSSKETLQNFIKEGSSL
ncbi:MAG: glutaredoxin [Proteobacteria bacterium]|nr:glutaredoxin [Pseudomonadota bacterium]